MPETQPILEVLDLHVHFQMLAGMVRAVDGVSFTVDRGLCLGIVGESGCGKSVTARSILRLLSSSQTSGQILYHADDDDPPIDLVSLDPKGDAIRAIRGQDIAMIFQEPMTSLTPVYTIGEQILESIRQHQNLPEEEAYDLAVSMLDKVGIPDAERRFGDYPHQMSGGMRQRVMIAIALSCQPRVLIADEPTTALDVTIQAQILRLIRSLQQDLDMSVIMITHDLAVIAQLADYVVVMYLGQMAEQAPVVELFQNPKHPYTQALLRSIVRPDTPSREQLHTISGSVPDPRNAPTGCRFRNRCPSVHDRCAQDPPIVAFGPRHTASCWLYVDDETE